MLPIATIIIPQYNQAHLTVACLKSLRQHEPTPVEIIVVDDGSDPDACQPFDTLHLPNFKLFQQTHAGITSAWNVAANHATTPHLIFLNNDTLCHGPVVERLIKPLSNNAILTGPSNRRETALTPDVLTNLPTEQFIEGWCMALTRTNFRKVGGFDESMKLYFSDTDFQSRLLIARRDTRVELVPIRSLPLRHQFHQTTRHLSTRRQQWQTDRQTFIQKWRNLKT